MPGLALRALGLVALLAGLWWLEHHIEQRGYDRAQAVYQAEIDRLQTEAATQLANETKRVRLAEHALQEAKNQQDRTDAKHTQTIAALSARLRAAAGPAGGLRDPYATQCGGSGDRPASDPAAASAAGATDRAQASGLLSEPLAELLQQLTREADEINVAYASCRTDAYTVRSSP